MSGARRKRQSTKSKVLAHIGTRTNKLEISSLMLYRLSYPGFDESSQMKVTFIHAFTSDTNYTLLRE